MKRRRALDWRRIWREVDEWDNEFWEKWGYAPSIGAGKRIIMKLVEAELERGRKGD